MEDFSSVMVVNVSLRPSTADGNAREPVFLLLSATTGTSGRLDSLLRKGRKLNLDFRTLCGDVVFDATSCCEAADGQHQVIVEEMYIVNGNTHHQ